MRLKQWPTATLLFLFIVLENLCLYYFFQEHFWTTGKNAIALFLSSLLFGIVFLYRFYNVSTVRPPAVAPRRQLWLSLSVLSIGFVLIGIRYHHFFQHREISVANSDIIPLIQVACRRLLSGQYVYSIVNDFGYTQDMTYLPLHWMPISLATITGIDARWVPQLLWAIVAVLVCIRSWHIPNMFMRAAVPIILLAANYVVFTANCAILQLTVEFLIAAYYMLLITSFSTGSAWLQGVAIGCCLLSRYSLALWLPLYAFVMLAAGHKRQFFTAAGIALGMVLLLYVIPFMLRDPHIFLNAYGYYTKAAFFEWTHVNKEGLPMHLFSGTGFAYYFYTRFTGLDIAERIHLLQRTHIVVCMAVTAGMAIWYYRHKHRVDHRLFLMGSFKIYLTFFLFLIQVPYVYLMCVGNFVSIIMFIEQAAYLRVPRQPLPQAHNKPNGFATLLLNM